MFLRDIFTSINELLQTLLSSFLPEWAVITVQNLIGVIIVASFGLTIILLTIWMERKGIGRMQDRLGPNRVGPYGLLQNVADALKMITKEVIRPDGADRVVYYLAPLLAVVSVLLIWAVMPFARTAIGTDVSIGALYFLSVGSLGTVAIIMAGWGSNNKYALLGAFRGVAQLISYEIPLILSLMVVVLLTGTMRMNEIVQLQSIWFVVVVPIPALIFFISSLAEVGRTPFDLLEAESEIIAGYHVEYTGMMFGMFQLGEFLHTFTISALVATLFLGGWRGPGAADIPTLGPLYFLGKTFLVYFLTMLVRGTLPRVRIDQLMNFNWKFLVPISLVTMMVVPLVDKIALTIPVRGQVGLYKVLTIADIQSMTVVESITANLMRAGVLLLTNVLIALGVLVIMAGAARRARRAAEAASVPVEAAAASAGN